MSLSIDPESETWRFIEAHANERLSVLRLQNDSIHLGVEQTAAIRGRIAELKSILSLLTKDLPLIAE